MAAGAPTIVARTGGLAEIVEGTGAGLLFEPGNHHDLADRIEEVLTDDEARRRRCARRPPTLLADAVHVGRDRRVDDRRVRGRVPAERSTPAVIADDADSRRNYPRRPCEPSVSSASIPAIPPSARPLHRAGDQPPLDVGPRDAAAVRRLDPRRVGGVRPRPAAAARARSTRARGTQLAARPGGRHRDRRRPRRRLDEAIARDHAGSRRRPRVAAQPRRLLLARVRHQRDAAAVQRRPRRARRRPPQGGERPRRPARRDRPAVRRGLLPPAAQRRRLPGGALPAAGPERAGADRHRRRGHGRRRRRPGDGAGVAGATSGGCSCTCSTPHVEGNSPTAPTITDRLYGGDAEHRLRQEIVLGIGGVQGARARSAWSRRCSTPTRATPGSSRSSGCRELVGQRADVRRGGRGGARRRRVHHAHARSRRHRPVRAVADGEVLRHVRRRQLRHRLRAR